MELSNRDLYNRAKEILSKNKDIEYFDGEIYAILMKASGYESFTELVLNFYKKCPNPQYFYRNLNRLIAGEPLQYILEEAPFLDYMISISEDVLIPRPETEMLVLETIKYINKNNLNHKIIADVCTGSGCIAVAMQKEYKNSTVFALDKYENVLMIAKKNFEKYQLPIICLQGDKVEPLIKRNIKVDILISNPPYVENINDIDKKVLEHEPINAIYIQDGTAFYENYFKNYQNIMNKNFLMAFEINYDQEEKLSFLIKNYFDLNKIEYEFKKDLYGKTRYLFIKGVN